MTPAPGILIANLGTPDAPTPRALRRYLAAFLGDRRMIEMPRALWLPLLHGVILNTRPRRSAKLYRAIWTEKGSPLMVISRRLVEGLQAALRERTGLALPVALGMRYGNPSIPAALRDLRDAGARRVLVLPLYPQYSTTTVGAVFDAVAKELVTWRAVPELRTIHGYHDHPAYIDALAESIRRHWRAHPLPPGGRLLLSFHGVPRAYVERGDPYQTECLRTARLVAERLDLPDGALHSAFQSKFGPGEWLTPAAAETVAEWGAAGVPRVDVLCPGFAVDSLETLEEIPGEVQEAYHHAGGREFHYIPALNDHADHVALLCYLVEQHLQGWV